ncbi:MAG: flagellar hook-basal body complex protein [Phycisphaerae bacterium]|nr:flagellar hook-basal body complex protein [Phycisphaerae bacterium]
MGLTSSLYTALSGLNVNQVKLDVTGNNIANVNTTAFKASTVSFQSQFSQTFSFGSRPSDNAGGSNPTQIGLGAVEGPIQRNMSPGSFETTGSTTDLAIEGSGWFVVQRSDGSRAYTRDGAFVMNGDNYLISGDGNYLMGFQVDSNFSVIPGSVGKLQVPIGEMRVAGATSNAVFSGNLNSDGNTATTGAILESQVLTDSSTSAAITSASLLSNVEDSGGDNLYAVGDTLTLRTDKGGRNLPESEFYVTATTTVDDLTNWLQDTLGIDTTAGLTPPPGVVVNAGKIVVTGNIGSANDLDIQSGDLLSSDGTAAPLTFTKTATADGESIYTSAIFFDSLGSKLTAGISLVLESKSGMGKTWRWFSESPDDTDASAAIGTGTLTFGNGGRLVASSGGQVVINREDTGAQTPLAIEYDFSSVTSLAADTSSLTMATQDGFPVGTLSEFAIGLDGTVVGTFSNGLSKTLGQIALATFANDSGLVAESDNLFSEGPNSGIAFIQAPTTGGAGKIASGALELSNVDISREFINLIVASTGFSAASRVINSSNQLLTELLQTVR